MSGLEDVLPWSDVPELMKLYENNDLDYPSYLVLENRCKWHTLDPDDNSVILCPNGKVNENGTFIVLLEIGEPAFYSVMFDSKNSDLEELRLLLMRCFQTFLSEFNHLEFGPLKQTLRSFLDEVMNYYNFKEDFHTNATCYFLNREKANELSSLCSEDALIGPLKEDHADLINSLWPHRFTGSIILIRKIIKINGGIGIFLKDSNELVSWALQGQLNGPSCVQTVESHKKKGYGRMGAVAITKYMAKQGFHSVLYVVENNAIAHHLYTSMGYNKIKDVYWTTYLKTKS